jgi:hypothetical protein
MMSKIHHFKAWQEVIQPRIEEAMVWKETIGPLLAEMAAHQRDSALSKSFYQSYQLRASTLAIKTNGRRGSSPHQ